MKIRPQISSSFSKKKTSTAYDSIQAPMHKFVSYKAINDQFEINKFVQHLWIYGPKDSVGIIEK